MAIRLGLPVLNHRGAILVVAHPVAVSIDGILYVTHRPLYLVESIVETTLGIADIVSDFPPSLFALLAPFLSPLLALVTSIRELLNAIYDGTRTDDCNH
jgi:hypothetical protein